MPMTDYKPFKISHLTDPNLQQIFNDVEAGKTVGRLPVPTEADRLRRSDQLEALRNDHRTIRLQVSGIRPDTFAAPNSFEEGVGVTEQLSGIPRPRPLQRGFVVSFTPVPEQLYSDCYASMNLGVDADLVRNFPIGAEILVVLPDPFDNATAWQPGKLGSIPVPMSPPPIGGR